MTQTETITSPTTAYFSSLLGTPITGLQPLAGGRNSRVYRLTAEVGSRFAAKILAVQRRSHAQSNAAVQQQIIHWNIGGAPDVAFEKVFQIGTTHLLRDRFEATFRHARLTVAVPFPAFAHDIIETALPVRYAP